MLSLIILCPTIIFYLLLAYFLFVKWLLFFIKDKQMTPDEEFLSRIILLIATIFWPIVVPFAYLELLEFHHKYKKDIDLLINQTNNQINDN